jgi:hypothetical protein
MGARSGAARDLSSPGEDTLLAGLDERAQTFPLRVKKARASDPQIGGAVLVGHATPRMPDVVARGSGNEEATLDAPPSAPKLAAASAHAVGVAAAVRPSDTNTDTFASQESDARRASKERTGRLLLPVALVALVLLAVGTFAALRTRSPAAASGPPATNAATNSNASLDTNANANANANAAAAAAAATPSAASADANTAAIPSAALAPADTAPGAPIPSATPVATRPTRRGGAHATTPAARGDATASPPGGRPAAIPAPPGAPATPATAPKTPGTPLKPDESLIRSL